MQQAAGGQAGRHKKTPLRGLVSALPKPLAGEGEGGGGVRPRGEGMLHDLAGEAVVLHGLLVLGLGLGVTARADSDRHVGDVSHAHLLAREEEIGLGGLHRLDEGQEGEGLGGLDLGDEGLGAVEAHVLHVDGEEAARLVHGGEVERAGEGDGGGGGVVDVVVHKQTR